MKILIGGKNGNKFFRIFDCICNNIYNDKRSRRISQAKATTATIICLLFVGCSFPTVEKYNFKIDGSEGLIYHFDQSFSKEKATLVVRLSEGLFKECQVVTVSNENLVLAFPYQDGMREDNQTLRIIVRDIVPYQNYKIKLYLYPRENGDIKKAHLMINDGQLRTYLEYKWRNYERLKKELGKNKDQIKDSVLVLIGVPCLAVSPEVVEEIDYLIDYGEQFDIGKLQEFVYDQISSKIIQLNGEIFLDER